MGYLGTGIGWQSSHGYRLQGRIGNRKREYEHRVIAERALGRRLTTSEEVHHADGNGLRNAKGNLVICARAFHKYLHFLERVRALGVTRADFIRMHHKEGMPLEEIKRRLGLGEGMIGRWFRRMNIEIRPGICGRGSVKHKANLKGNQPVWVMDNG